MLELMEMSLGWVLLALNELGSCSSCSALRSESFRFYYFKWIESFDVEEINQIGGCSIFKINYRLSWVFRLLTPCLKPSYWRILVSLFVVLIASWIPITMRIVKFVVGVP